MPLLDALQPIIALFVRVLSRHPETVDWRDTVTHYFASACAGVRRGDRAGVSVDLGCLSTALLRGVFRAPADVRPAVVELAAAISLLQMALRGDAQPLRAAEVLGVSLQHWTALSQRTDVSADAATAMS